MGYVDWVDDTTAARGTARVSPTRSSPGYNLYNSRHQAVAELLDIYGNVVHTWSAAERTPGWHHIEPLPDGRLLTIRKNKRLSMYAPDSSILWSTPLAAHHDLSVLPDGKIAVLTRRVRSVEHNQAKVWILDDQITLLSEAGKPTQRHALFPILGGLVSDKRWDAIRSQAQKRHPTTPNAISGTAADLLHTNSIQYLNRDLPGVCKRGDFLVSVRELNTIAVIDPDAGILRWHWGPGQLQRQHHATMLANGNIMLFDNGTQRGSSRIVELDPRTRIIEWEYRGEPPEAFFSHSRGGVQALPNGNILVTESNKGHVFELDRLGEIVWEFWNPHRRKHAGRKQRGAIYRMQRLPPPFATQFLRQAAP